MNNPLEVIETIRKEAMNSSLELHVTDHGSGTRKNLSATRSLSKIVKQTAIGSRYGKVLMNMAAHYSPATILELGTGTGISTLYMAQGNPASRVVTIEGSVEIAATAEKHFAAAGSVNITLHTGQFSEVLTAILPVLTHPLMRFRS